MASNVPPNWYVYDWPLPEVPGAPVPSKADYSPKNVAPLIESFASFLGTTKDRLTFRYENNTPKKRSDDILVKHPNDRDYLPEYLEEHKVKSPELLRYEVAAKQSVRLILFQDNSPAKIKYFQKIGE
jgi:hypothetical protein